MIQECKREDSLIRANFRRKGWKGVEVEGTKLVCDSEDMCAEQKEPSHGMVRAMTTEILAEQTLAIVIVSLEQTLVLYYI